MKKIYKKRLHWIHKGQNGRVLVVAGSTKYTGSPIFNGIAALRTGADLVTIAAPQRAADVAANFAPDLITVPLKGNYLTRRHLPIILELANTNDAVILGCGLGREKETFKAIRELLEKIKLPMVIDADAIRALKDHQEIIKNNKRIVITPHVDEFLSLTGEKALPEVDDRKKKVKKWAKIFGVVILLKGHIDVISDGRRVYLNKTGSVYMTKGGFGDTLSGICGALLARGISPFEAAKAAAWLNGKAGERACEKHSEGVIASDIFTEIPKVIKNL